MEVYIPTIIKSFAIIISSIFLFNKIINVKLTSGKKLICIAFMVIVTPITALIRINFPIYTILFEALCLALFMHRLLKRNFAFSVGITTLSVGLSYVVFSLSVFISSPLIFVFFNNQLNTFVLDIISTSIVGIVQNTLVILIFRVKRLRHGIPKIESNLSGDVGIFMGSVVIFISSLLFTNGKADFFLNILYIFITILSGVIIYLWWKKYILNHYIRQSQNRHIVILEETIKKQEEEIQQLSKIIHKDNKLLGALSLTVQEVLTENNEVDKEKILTEIRNLTDERHKTLSTYEKEEQNLPATGVVSIDIILNYLSKRAVDKDINFSIAINCSIGYFTESIFNENDLSTILADLGENAIIAVNKAINKNIMISFGIENDCYVISIFDSGLPFDSAVIANIGKRRYTTHKNEGGSGIGLMTTLELLKPYSASFEIEDINDNSLFTKKVSVVFDGNSRIRIKSSRMDVIAESKKRTDIVLIND